jgi:hypothetical protein
LLNNCRVIVGIRCGKTHPRKGALPELGDAYRPRLRLDAALAPAGHIYVIDKHSSSLWSNASGSWQMQTLPSVMNQAGAPWAIAADASNRIHIAEIASGEIRYLICKVE